MHSEGIMAGELKHGPLALVDDVMPLPLTVSCFSKIQIGFTFLVTAHLGSLGKGPLNRCVCVCVIWWCYLSTASFLLENYTICQFILLFV